MQVSAERAEVPPKKDHFNSSSTQEFHAKDQSELSQWKESLSQAQTTSHGYHDVPLKSQTWRFQNWPVFFNMDVPSWLRWSHVFRSWHWYDYLLWVPLALFCTLLVFFPRTALTLLWVMVKQMAEVVFDFLFGDASDEDEPQGPQEEDVLIRKHGIARPANTLWQVPWHELTEGQRFVIGQLGIHDEQTWLHRCEHDEASSETAACIKQSRKDWDDLSFKQRFLLSRLGFSRESWHGLGEEMQIHEKTWHELIPIEKEFISKLDIVDADAWNKREAELFHAPWLDLKQKMQADSLRKLGFDARNWKPFRDPNFSPPTLAKYASLLRRWFGHFLHDTRLIIGVLFFVWTLFALWQLDLMQALLHQVVLLFFRSL